jgi:phosphoribosyl-ATP pyrophosphohydrolase/phosphoribosyl-AMP cyclohydrolase
MNAVSLNPDALDWSKGNGLVTVVAQDASSGAVLMVAHADREALAKTIETGEMHYRSRTRGLWHKGATSGNVQRVVSLAADCDGDAVLALVRPAGPACHNGTTSCFAASPASNTLASLDETIASRALDQTADGSYTRRLLSDRNLRLKKIGEESAELVTALADNDATRAAAEAADLVYHVLVALRAAGVGLDAVRDVLSSRAEARSAGVEGPSVTVEGRDPSATLPRR